MAHQFELSSAPNECADLPAENTSALHLQFLELINVRHRQITLIKQLHHMVHTVQLHRGMSMSLLAGNKFIAEDIHQLQSNLEQRLALIEALVAVSPTAITEHDKENLHQAWNTIRHDWQNDKLLDNFELHSHFISQLNDMIRELGQTLAKPLAVSLETPNNHYVPPAELGYPALFKNIELLNFISNQLPQMVEIFARLRGLASHAAAADRVELAQDRKLRFLLDQARQQHEKTRLQAKRINELWQGQLPSLKLVATMELKVLFLFTTVGNDILSGRTIQIEGHVLFKSASEIIDTYSDIIEDGWNLIRRQLDREMEAWIALQGRHNLVQ